MTPAADADVFEVPESLGGERVDRAVAMLTGFSRADVQELLTAGLVLVDGRPVSKSRRLHPGETVEVAGRPEEARPPEPEDLPLDVRYEDDDVIVLSKAPGVVVHPGSGNEHGTLVNALLARRPEIAGVGDPLRPGIVHRLDRDTSGLMVVARSSAAYQALVEAMAERRVERRYLALVWGRPDPPRGAVDAPIGRSPRHRTRMAVTPSGRDARTGYEVREVFAVPEVSLVECRLETGRTHQIRVHLAAIGHPVVGDDAYGGGGRGLEVPRMWLHAHRLGFDHPVTGETLAFEDPPPADLSTVLDRLRSHPS